MIKRTRQLKVVTPAVLRKAGACLMGMKEFAVLFPDGVAEVTPENLDLAIKKRFPYPNFARDLILTKTQKERYYKLYRETEVKQRKVGVSLTGRWKLLKRVLFD